MSTFQLFQMYPDAESARLYFERRLWPNGPVCPTCGSLERITTRKGGYYRCNACKFDFTVRTGTVFGRSHVPLHKWLATARKGISSLQLSKQIGIAQKSAWFVLQRLREACGNDTTLLSGIVETSAGWKRTSMRARSSKPVAAQSARFPLSGCEIRRGALELGELL